MNTGNVPFKQLTDEQKGWLLLQNHKGVEIQSLGTDNIWYTVNPEWVPNQYYRVKPAPKEVSFVRTFRNKMVTISCTVCPDTYELSNFRIVTVTDT